MEKDISQGIEITRVPEDKRIAISERGLEIRREGKHIRFEMPTAGFVYLLIDCSPSMIMPRSKLSQAKNGAINFAKDALKKGYLVGLIKFNEYATHLCAPTEVISVLERYLKTLKTDQCTYMARAIDLAHQKLKNQRGIRVMVIATDGMPNELGDPRLTLETGAKAKRDGIDIITIGTDDADKDFLKKLASRTNLGVKVSREQFGKGISSVAKMLPQLERGKREG